MAPSLEERLDAVISDYGDRNLFSGTVLIAQADDIVFERGYGKADDQRGVDNQPDTIYRIGSVSKQFTAALALQLVERGRLDLDASISTYLPDYPRPHGDRITVRMLLSHTSGIPSYTALPIYRDAMSEAEAPKQFMRKFAGLELDFEPGRDFRYSNSGYYVLGVILEEVCGRELLTLLRTRLFEPLKLEDTGYDGPTISGARRAKGYTWNGTEHAPEVSVDPSKIFAAGMMYSTAEDLLRWTRALHRGTPFRDPGTHRTMTQLPPGKDSNYQFGLGIVTLELAGETLVGVGHGGGLEGFQSSLLYVPDKEWTVVVLCNSGDEVGPLADALVAVLAGDEPPPPLIPLSREFARLIDTQGLDVARAWLVEVTTSGSARLSVDPEALDALGQRYLSGEESEHAVAVFELAVEVSADSPGAHRHLAEALVVDGELSTALTHYQRVLELEPTDDETAVIVDRLQTELKSR